jgi:hypothetical protein
MTRLIVTLAVAFVVGGIGLASGSYIQNHQQPLSGEPIVVAVSKAHGMGPPRPSDVQIGNRGHMTPQERVAFDKREVEAAHIIAAAKDKYLTGDPNGNAEWHSANDESVTCGVTPQNRYIIVRNDIGTSRYDEPSTGSKIQFIGIWSRIDCDATAPVRQAAILARQAEERLYDDTHPIDPDCLIREMKEIARGGASAARRQLAHPHECQGPRAVWQAAMSDQNAEAAQALSSPNP